MFKLEAEPTFEANVKIRMPGGTLRVVRVEFNLLDQEGYEKVVDETRGEKLCMFVARLVKGWRTEPGKDAQGVEWEAMAEAFSTTALETLQKRGLFVLRAMFDTYLHEVYGQSLKN